MLSMSPSGVCRLVDRLEASGYIMRERSVEDRRVTYTVLTDAGEQAQPGTEVKVSRSDYGRILFDGSDQAIYLFEKERGAKSECYGECAEAWPPVLTEGEPVASGGADQGLLGTTERDDGSTQVTYGGHPLYYYVDDPKGEVLCQNVEEFGGLWLVVAPDGEAVR